MINSSTILKEFWKRLSPSLIPRQHLLQHKGINDTYTSEAIASTSTVEFESAIRIPQPRPLIEIFNRSLPLSLLFHLFFTHLLSPTPSQSPSPPSSPLKPNENRAQSLHQDRNSTGSPLHMAPPINRPNPHDPSLKSIPAQIKAKVHLHLCFTPPYLAGMSPTTHRKDQNPPTNHNYFSTNLHHQASTIFAYHHMKSMSSHHWQ